MNLSTVKCLLTLPNFKLALPIIICLGLPRTQLVLQCLGLPRTNSPAMPLTTQFVLQCLGLPRTISPAMPWATQNNYPEVT